MMRLGQLVARAVDTPRRAVTAITLPCLAYAALAVGCVLSRDPRGFSPDAPSDKEQAAHFANLCALSPGTTVTVVSGRIKRVGRFTGVDHSRGQPHLIIAQRTGYKSKQGFTQYIPLRDAHNVAVRGLPQVR